ncbi:MAG: sodium-dependent bicarbonate transport family permease, partial [Rhodobacteraceae bacterium]|nr:sodium-dependent bicarbonate transport family permease [Paracoccaceae bacterium]
MEQIFALAADNLLSPIILCFLLGVGAAMARSDLSVPEAAAKALSLYLLFAIGFKGGASVAAHGVEGTLVLALLAGIGLSFGLPIIAFTLLNLLAALDRTNAGAIAAHYGSISIVTFVAGTSVLDTAGLVYDGYMVAVAAAMEAPAILSALWLISRGGAPRDVESGLWREILLNGSIVLLIGSFLIGWATGKDGLAQLDSFIVAPFQGVLCLFLLDMGLVAGRGLRNGGAVLQPGILIFGVLMPLIGGMLGLGAGLLLGLET